MHREENAEADLRRALIVSPPDVLALVSLAQRAGARALDVGAQHNRRTPLLVAAMHVAAMHSKAVHCLRAAPTLRRVTRPTAVRLPSPAAC